MFLTIPQTILVFFFDGNDSLISDSVIFVFVISIYIGTYIHAPKLKIPKLKNLKLTKSFLYIIIAICAIPLFPMLLKFGLSVRGVRDFYEQVVFSQYSSFYAILKICITCLIIIAFIQKKRITTSILILSIILIFSGSKMAILNTFIVFASLWEQYRKMNYRKFTIIAVIAFIGIVGYHSLQNTNKNFDAIESALSYFDVYNQQTKAIEMFQSGKLEYYHGEIAVSSYYKIIPRIIWPNKPKDYGFALLNYKIYPQYSADGYMPSFGLAYTFADFGWLSIILSGVLTGFMQNMWYKEFLRNKKNIPSFIIYMLSLDIVISLLLGMFYLLSNLRHDTQNNSFVLVER